jgi:hypothetical protein
MHSNGVVTIEISGHSASHFGVGDRAGKADALWCDAALAGFAVAGRMRGVATGSDRSEVHEVDELRKIPGRVLATIVGEDHLPDTRLLPWGIPHKSLALRFLRLYLTFMFCGDSLRMKAWLSPSRTLGRQSHVFSKSMW